MRRFDRLCRPVSPRDTGGLDGHRPDGVPRVKRLPCDLCAKGGRGSDGRLGLSGVDIPCVTSIPAGYRVLKISDWIPFRLGV
jgi:hypothetical protein